jgi:HlyD family secretion protein
MIKPGQTVSITIDAMPDRHFTGKVKKKAVLPSSQSWWANPDLKVYETDIALDGGNPGNVLRPGMTATVEILIEKIENVLRVPIQSVQTDEKGKHYCYLKSGNRVEVTIGKRNQVYVEVLDGVKEGDEVLMTPPELTDGEES